MYCLHFSLSQAQQICCQLLRCNCVHSSHSKSLSKKGGLHHTLKSSTMRGTALLQCPWHSRCPHRPPWTPPDSSVARSCLFLHPPPTSHPYVTSSCLRKSYKNISKNNKKNIFTMYYKISLQQIRIFEILPKSIS